MKTRTKPLGSLYRIRLQTDNLYLAINKQPVSMRRIFVLLLFICANAKAQNTLSFTENSTSPKADLSEIAWMEGHWKGEAFGGTTEEIWSPPLGGSMMFSFKLVNEEVVSFYELLIRA